MIFKFTQGKDKSKKIIKAHHLVTINEKFDNQVEIGGCELIISV